MEKPLVTKLLRVKLKGVIRLVSEVTVIVNESLVKPCAPRAPVPVPLNVYVTKLARAGAMAPSTATTAAAPNRAMFRMA